MANCRRAWHPGGTYFFTVNLLQRHGNDRLTRHIEMFREIVASVQSRHPFRIPIDQDGVFKSLAEDGTTFEGSSQSRRTWYLAGYCLTPAVADPR